MGVEGLRVVGDVLMFIFNGGTKHQQRRGHGSLLSAYLQKNKKNNLAACMTDITTHRF